MLGSRVKWHENQYFHLRPLSNQSTVDSEIWSLYRPLTPVLSRNSLKETPKPGKNNNMLLRDYSELFQSRSLKVLEVEDVPELCLETDEIL